MRPLNKARTRITNDERPRHECSDSLPRWRRSRPVPSANKLIEKLTVQDPEFISFVVIAEVARVLRSRYRAKPLEIADAIERIPSIDRLMVQNEQQAYQAAVALRAGEGALADAVICAIGSSAGCTKTPAFDDLSCLSHFEVV